MADRNQRLIGAQREFVADASHQLRTPLTALRLRLEEARATSGQESVVSDLDAGTAEVDRLAVIVDELLVLSRAEDRELQGERVVLLDARRSRRRALGHRIRSTQHHPDVESQAPGAAWCAPADLDRALDVLIENALHYSPGGSEVTLLAREQPRSRYATAAPDLAPGEQDIVFDRFHRGRAGRRGPAGSGLGLAIARTLARAWHGEVTLAGRTGGGVVAAHRVPGASPMTGSRQNGARGSARDPRDRGRRRHHMGHEPAREPANRPRLRTADRGIVAAAARGTRDRETAAGDFGARAACSDGHRDEPRAGRASSGHDGARRPRPRRKRPPPPKARALLQDRELRATGRCAATTESRLAPAPPAGVIESFAKP